MHIPRGNFLFLSNKGMDSNIHSRNFEFKIIVFEGKAFVGISIAYVEFRLG